MKRAFVLLVIVAAFLCGFFVGRKFPSHHYVQYARGGLLFDTVTGKLCNPAPDPQHNFPACSE
jgi:hypothetical protein